MEPFKTALSDTLYAGYVCFHPFAGFYDLKFVRKRSLGAAFMLLACLCLAVVLKLQLTGFLFQKGSPEDNNIPLEIAAVVLPVFFWSLTNWAITTLLDGKANFRMIFTATVFALTPMIVIYLPTTALSCVLSLSEGVFITFLDGAAAVWSGALLIFGLATVQEYGVFKTLYTTVLTLLAIAALVFLASVFYSALQQLAAFVIQLKYEIQYLVR